MLEVAIVQELRFPTFPKFDIDRIITKNQNFKIFKMTSFQKSDRFKD